MIKIFLLKCQIDNLLLYVKTPHTAICKNSPYGMKRNMGSIVVSFFLSGLRSDDCSLASRSAIIYFYTSQPAAG